MLVAALLVGALTAYYFGLRAGLWAAVVTFAACLGALFVPKYALYVYLVLGAGVVGVCLVGPRRPRPTDSVRAVRALRRVGGLVVGQARGLFGRYTGKGERDEVSEKRRERDRRR